MRRTVRTGRLLRVDFEGRKLALAVEYPLTDIHPSAQVFDQDAYEDPEPAA